MAVEGRSEGLPQVWILSGSALDAHLADPAAGSPALIRVPTRESTYTIATTASYQFDARTLRFVYTSPLTPRQTCELDVSAALAASSDSASLHAGREVREAPASAVTLLKERPAPNYERSLYACGRLWCRIPGGASGTASVDVPITIVWRKDQVDAHVDDTDGEVPRAPSTPAALYLYGYGSYGISIDPTFDSNVLSLLDRGIVCAFAHIRGGGEMGRPWYEEQGKFLTKKNTFEDFVACAEHLCDAGWARRGSIVCHGASAGGLLMGNVVAMRPDLWAGVVGEVPFVDLMVTMCDPSIPLTVGEWDEWGNPNVAKFYDYMREYCPMDRLRPAVYPPTLLTAGLHDPRVQFWEPAKFAARLRDAGLPGSGPVLFKVDMSSGHFSASDRYRYLREESFVFAFILDSLGLALH